MIGVAQFGIALGALGVVLTLIGLFPGAIGFAPVEGIGIVQFAGIIMGFALLILGALMYAKFTFYVQRAATLAQQIGVRLALTGLVLASMVGLADAFGYGSHPRTETEDMFFGPLQAVGTLLGFIIASLGVAIYALTGRPPTDNNLS